MTRRRRPRPPGAAAFRNPALEAALEPAPTLRRAALAALLLTLAPALPAAAQQEGGFAGLWAYDEADATCDRAAPTERVPVLVEPQALHFYESRCDIEAAEPVDVGNALRLRLACTGEGETWQATALAYVDVDDRLYLHWADGGTFVGRRCP